MAREIVWSTEALCDALCQAKNLNTDYKLAKYLGMNQSTVSLWRRGATVMSDDWGKRIAAELSLDPAYVCLCLASERSPDANLASQMRAWLQAHATAAALALCAVFIGVSVPAPAHASEGIAPSFSASPFIHYARLTERLRRATRKLRANFAPRFGPLPLVGALAGC